LRHILDQAEGLPPAIDPVGWVTERAYNQREVTASLQNFLRERDQSLFWLRNLSSPDWNAAVEGPFGRIHAGDMLAAWVAHDLLHIRQLTELNFAYHREQINSYRVDYAGTW